MNLALLAEQNLATFGEYDRLVFEGKTYTNRALHTASSRFASALSILGLSPGDRVVVMMPNCPEVLISYPAVWRAGMAIVPVLFALESTELEHIVTHSGAKAVVTSPDVYPKVAEAIRKCGRALHVIVAARGGAVPSGAISFDGLVADSPPSEVVDRSPSDLATLLYTSGTTGRPKGVMQTHGNLHANVTNAWNTAKHREPGEMNLLVLPLAHTFGLSVLLGGYLFGSRAVLMRRFDAERALELVQAHKVKAMSGVPTMFVYMLMHPNAHRFDTSSVTRWMVGAAPMPTEQLKRFEERFGGTMYVGYGLSEASPSLATEREGMPRKLGSTGVPVEGVTLKIVDDEGRDLPRGQVGEIIAKGANISPGYYNNPEATAETFRNGWLFTGDLGYQDEDDYVFVVERKKDLIIRGGLNIYPKDVEEIIHRHPAVKEAAVVGVPDSMMGEEVCAYLVPRTGVQISAEEIIAYCQSSLAKYKTPRYVEVVDDLPRTTIGKIQKKELRKLAASRYAR